MKSWHEQSPGRCAATSSGVVGLLILGYPLASLAWLVIKRRNSRLPQSAASREEDLRSLARKLAQGADRIADEGAGLGTVDGKRGQPRQVLRWDSGASAWRPDPDD